MPPKRKTKAAAAAAAATTSTSDDTSTDTDWEAMKVPELRKACQSKGLDSTGNKATLVQRLQNQSADNDESPPVKIKKEDSFNTKAKKALEVAKKEPKAKRKPKVDACCKLSDVEVYEDYDCMLNQTNIGDNNNKYYIIQVLHKDNKSFWTWNRWGRVGEDGQNSLKAESNDKAAIKSFEKKFKDKTKNSWDKRDDFKPSPGKYTYLEMGDDDEDEEEEADTVDNITFGSAAKILGDPKRASKLDPETRQLIELLFDVDMFQGQMKDMELDVKKMPLGKLSKAQIAKGFDTLVAIEDALKEGKPASELERLSSQFFTQIPHSFGRNRPPVINDLDVIRKKKDVLLVLSDIELAQSMQKDQKDTCDIHPIDAKYKLLECKLEPLDPVKDKTEYDVIKKYVEATKPNYVNLLDVWRMERENEPIRFRIHKDIKHRKLLWHGTNVAVVAAILKTGLRIMPHSGGRVGKGLYFASQNEKSSGYVGPAQRQWKGKDRRVGLMFLAEVALGKENYISRDDSSLTSPPAGFDSVVARGQVEPDPKENTTLKLDGYSIVVPQGKPVEQPDYKGSSFYQSEYLVYKESQVRLRYLLSFDFNYSW